MQDNKGLELKEGSRVRVLEKAGHGYRKGGVVEKKDDKESFDAVIVGFAGEDRIIVVEGAKDTGGPRFSVTSDLVEKIA